MNSVAIAPIDRSPEALPWPRLLAVYLAETRCEMLRLLRVPALVLPVMLVPVALYGLFAVLIAGDAIAEDPALGAYMFASFAGMGVTMPGLFGISASLGLDRELGVLRLKRAQPAPGGSWLVAKSAGGLTFGALAYVPVLVMALATGRLALRPGEVAALSAALLAGAIPFCALGLALGMLVTGSAAPGYANLAYLPGCYLSGMFFPLPEPMHWQVPLWPQFHLQQLAMHGAGATRYQLVPVQQAVAALVAFTVLFGAVAVWRLARDG